VFPLLKAAILKPLFRHILRHSDVVSPPTEYLYGGAEIAVPAAKQPFAPSANAGAVTLLAVEYDATL